MCEQVALAPTCSCCADEIPLPGAGSHEHKAGRRCRDAEPVAEYGAWGGVGERLGPGRRHKHPQHQRRSDAFLTRTSSHSNSY